MRYIYSIRKTFQGAYAINGVIGERQYFGYSKRVPLLSSFATKFCESLTAEQNFILYNKECKKEKKK